MFVEKEVILSWKMALISVYPVAGARSSWINFRNSEIILEDGDEWRFVSGRFFYALFIFYQRLKKTVDYSSLFFQPLPGKYIYTLINH